jgi:hypothetical protein
MFSLRIQRRTSLLALFVLLWGLVFPTLAQAGVGDANAVWTEVCTAQGLKKIQQTGADTLAPAAHHYTAEHCALCCLGGVLEAVQPIQVPLAWQVSVSVALLPAEFVLPQQRFILLNAPPRAPPLLSLA